MQPLTAPMCPGPSMQPDKNTSTSSLRLLSVPVAWPQRREDLAPGPVASHLAPDFAKEGQDLGPGRCHLKAFLIMRFQMCRK